jgi:glyoxylase-like metal-dependent hydrolase (beta-lactamase superfamily II)
MKLEANYLDEASNQGFDYIPIPVYVFETSKGYVMYDTGCDKDSVMPIYPPNDFDPTDGEYMPYHLEKAGIKAEDIKYLVISHLHVDHCGKAAYYPKATCIINNQEFSQQLHQYMTDTCTNPPKRDLEAFFSSGMKFQTLADDVKELELVPGLTILNLGAGHAYGMIGLYVELEEGNFVIASDCIYCAAHGYPDYQMPGIGVSVEGYKETVRYLEKYAKDHNAKILFGHDAEQFPTLKQAPGAYYA